MRIIGGRGISILEGREVVISSGWLPLSEQIKTLQRYNERLDEYDLTRLAPSVFEDIQRSELDQAQRERVQYPSIALELFSPSATAVASWGPLTSSFVSDEPGGPLDLLPPIREWRAAAHPPCFLSVVEHTFFDVSGLTLEEITETIDLDPPLSMAGHEIALAVYLQGSDLRGYLRENDYRVVVPGVTMAEPDTLHPYVSRLGAHVAVNGLGLFAERRDRCLKGGTFLSIVTDRTPLARLS